MNKSKAWIYLLVFGVMIVWGLNVIAIKVIVAAFPAITITAQRIFVAFLSITPILFMGKHFRKLTKKEFGLIVSITITGVLCHHLFLSVGLSKTTASNGGLILGTVPLTTSMFATLILKERFTVHRLFGILLGIAGVCLIVLSGQEETFAITAGDGLMILAVISQAVSFILIKMASETIDTKLITGYSQLIGALLLFIVGLGIEPGGLYRLADGTAAVWIVFFASGIVATGIGHLLYNHAIEKIGPAESSVFLNMTPFFALVGSYLFLGERLYITHVLGFILIVAGVLFGTGVIEHWIHKRKKRFEVADRIDFK